MIAALILAWVSATTATSVVRPPQPRETLLVDTRVPVLVGDEWMIMSQEEHQRHLRKREESDGGEITTTITVETSTATASPTTTTYVSSPLPSPFDTAIASNFSSSDGDGCADFINDLLVNPDFKSCYAFSMLIQGSNSFFQAEKSLVSITQVLDATCNGPNVTFCTKYMNDAAKNLTDSSNCATDFELENSLVVQVYAGLKAYQPMYSASCLKTADTSAYCFANAVTNRSALADVYLYYLPLNISYPNSTVPNCNECTRSTMGIFQAATADRDAYIANTYADAADTINAECGVSYVNATLPQARVSNAATSVAQAPPLLLLLSFGFMVFSHWIL
ncbi:hypothetical protein JX265_007611 [Neoarthrinium moseri]|uniref:DUF7729 domain-containing protein n=1 Tax=Neoarthrinium moseri TaxID=1658444 RepID=A0A9P9WJT6_9PEZI|nr:hypothetical protein JX266_000639 [Neoarthrinium moseri]KAI1867035.1 hypothetical protein JX265_007611 [Neoarthrinium moseri]